MTTDLGPTYEMLDLLEDCPSNCPACPGHLDSATVRVKCVHPCHKLAQAPSDADRREAPVQMVVMDEHPATLDYAAVATPPGQPVFDECLAGTHNKCPGRRTCACSCHPWSKEK